MSEEFERLLAEIVRLSLPPESKSIKEIAKLVNRGRTTVTKYRKVAKEKGLFQTSEKGHIIKSKPDNLIKVYEDLAQTDFLEIPTIKTWKNFMQGSGIKRPMRYVANLYKICKTLDRHPDIFLGPIQEAERYKNEFVELFRQGKTQQIMKKIHPSYRIPNSESIPKPYVDAIKSFRHAHEKPVPYGFLKSMQPRYDSYAKIKLNDMEIKQGYEFFTGDIQKLFILQHEFGPRPMTLVTMQINYTKKSSQIDGINCEYYECDIYEPKQQKHFQKIAFTRLARQVIESIPNGSKIHTNKDNWDIKTQYNQKLREFYASLGKIELDKEYQKGTQEWYYQNDPSHAIRHSCIHWLMRCTGFRKDTVASFFWDSPETLKVYAQQTTDEMIRQGMCYLCKPPQIFDMKEKLFCSLRHAIAWENLTEDQLKERTYNKLP